MSVKNEQTCALHNGCHKRGTNTNEIIANEFDLYVKYKI